jgi:hypothetical protein
MAKTMTVANSGTILGNGGSQPLDQLISVSNNMATRVVTPGTESLGAYVRMRHGIVDGSQRAAKTIYYHDNQSHWVAFELIPGVMPDPGLIVRTMILSDVEQQWLDKNWEEIINNHV